MLSGPLLAPEIYSEAELWLKWFVEEEEEQKDNTRVLPSTSNRTNSIYSIPNRVNWSGSTCIGGVAHSL